MHYCINNAKINKNHEIKWFFLFSLPFLPFFYKKIVILQTRKMKLYLEKRL